MLKRQMLIALAVLPLISCKQIEISTVQPVQLVQDILSGNDPAAASILKASAKQEPDRNITIFGDPQRCLALRNAFLSVDDFDNVDGRLVPDRLPDFCGERFAVTMDVACVPYKRYTDGAQEDSLRELAVRAVLSALDTVCFISPYDKEGLGRKMRSKLIILESAFMGAFGHYDADSLLRASGCHVHVLTPFGTMLEQVSDAHPGKGINVGVIAERSSLAAGAYSACLKNLVRSRHLPASECIAFPRNRDGEVLTGFLDKYAAAGYNKPLDAILVDDFDTDVEELEMTLARIRSILGEESFTYGRLLSPDIRILDARKTLTRKCFRIFREENLFTHKILFPKADHYITAKNGMFPPFVTVNYSPRYMPSKFEDIDVQD